MFAVLGFVLLRLIFRRTALAIVAWVVVLCAVSGDAGADERNLCMDCRAYQACMIALLTIMVVRLRPAGHGCRLRRGQPPGRHSADVVVVALDRDDVEPRARVVLALTCFGFYAARAGQPLFGKLD